MEAAINTFSIDIPLQDLSFFKEMIVRMGWKSKPENIVDTHSANKKEEIKAVDLISSPWPDDGLSADEFVALCESRSIITRKILEI